MSDTRAFIDFSEIKSATEFEQFTRDLLQSMGYRIETPPGEGNDGGKDMIVSELMEGRLSSKKVRYLVSCKHTKHAVGTADEGNITQRVDKHGCHAFLGVYSSHLTQTLVNDFEGLKRSNRNGELFDIVVLDGAAITKELFENVDGPRLVRQYFPRAHLAYLKSVTESYVFHRRPIFRCAECKDDILSDLQGYIVYESSYGSADDPYKPSEDGGNRIYLHDIKPYCRAHAPDSAGLPAGWTMRPLEKLIDPAAYMRLVSEDIGFRYFKPPYFMNENIFRKWNHLTQGLFYFVARGKPMPEPERPMLFSIRYEL